MVVRVTILLLRIFALVINEPVPESVIFVSRLTVSVDTSPLLTNCRPLNLIDFAASVPFPPPAVKVPLFVTFP